MRRLVGITVSMKLGQTPEDGEGQGSPALLPFTGSQRVKHDLEAERQHK